MVRSATRCSLPSAPGPWALLEVGLVLGLTLVLSLALVSALTLALALAGEVGKIPE